MNVKNSSHGSDAAGSTFAGRLKRTPYAPLSVRSRLVALTAAALAATLSVGSQFGLLALYSGEAKMALAATESERNATHVVASVVAVERRSQFARGKLDHASRRWPWMHGYGRFNYLP